MAISTEQQGVLWGIVGVAAFSLTLPMTYRTPILKAAWPSGITSEFR